jgi:hypothetical protein
MSSIFLYFPPNLHITKIKTSKKLVISTKMTGIAGLQGEDIDFILPSICFVSSTY